APQIVRWRGRIRRSGSRSRGRRLWRSQPERCPFVEHHLACQYQATHRPVRVLKFNTEVVEIDVHAGERRALRWWLLVLHIGLDYSILSLKIVLRLICLLACRTVPPTPDRPILGHVRIDGLAACHRARTFSADRDMTTASDGI